MMSTRTCGMTNSSPGQILFAGGFSGVPRRIIEGDKYNVSV